MSRAIKQSLEALEKWVFASKSRVQKIARGQGIAGTRAAPTQSGNNDKKIGSRLDNGETYIKDGKEHKRYKFQINKGAENKTLKDIANKDSHQVFAQADIVIGGTDEHSIVENMFGDLKKDLEKER